MPTEKRSQRVTSLLKEEIAKIIDREVEFPEGMMLTLTHLTISSDHRYANVLISVMGGEANTALEILNRNIYDIQQMVNRSVNMRPVPKITFLVNEEEMRREQVEKSLAELKRKGEL